MALEGLELQKFLIEERATKLNAIYAARGSVVWYRLKRNGQSVGGENDYSKVHKKAANSPFTLCGLNVPEWAHTGDKYDLQSLECSKCKRFWIAEQRMAEERERAARGMVCGVCGNSSQEPVAK